MTSRLENKEWNSIHAQFFKIFSICSSLNPWMENPQMYTHSLYAHSLYTHSLYTHSLYVYTHTEIQYKELACVTMSW